MASLAQPCAGTAAAAVTTANASQGNQWDSVPLIGAGSTMAYDTTHVLHGLPTSIKIHYAAVSTSVYAQWKAAITATANGYVRAYFYLSAVPTITTRMLSLLSGTNTLATNLQIVTGTGVLRTVNSAGTTLATMVATMPLNQWVRLELEATGISGSTGTVAARMYSGANLDGWTPDTNGSLSTAGANVTGTIDDARYAASSASTYTAAWDLWMQECAWSDSAQPGPVRTPRPVFFSNQSPSRASSF